MSDNKTRANALLDGINLDWDVDNFVYPAVLNMIEKGEPDEKILKDILQFTADATAQHRRNKVHTLTTAVVDGIRRLGHMREWITLNSISKQVRKEFLAVLKREAAAGRRQIIEGLYEYEVLRHAVFNDDVCVGNLYDKLVDMLPEAKRLQNKHRVLQNKSRVLASAE